MNFLDSLQDIKKELLKEQKQKNQDKKEEPKDEFETAFAKEERLVDEFKEFIKHSGTKKLF